VRMISCGETSEFEFATMSITDTRGWPLTLSDPEGGSGHTLCRTTVPEGAEFVPETYALHPPKPNPTNPSTVISFGIPASAGRGVDVRLVIFDVTGRVVRQLTDAEYGPGEHEALWDGKDAKGTGVASGIYFCRLEAGPYTEIRRLTVVK
jgi:hypothetical protein